MYWQRHSCSKFRKTAVREHFAASGLTQWTWLDVNKSTCGTLGLWTWAACLIFTHSVAVSLHGPRSHKYFFSFWKYLREFFSLDWIRLELKQNPGWMGPISKDPASRLLQGSPHKLLFIIYFYILQNRQLMMKPQHLLERWFRYPFSLPDWALSALPDCIIIITVVINILGCSVSIPTLILFRVTGDLEPIPYWFMLESLHRDTSLNTHVYYFKHSTLYLLVVEKRLMWRTAFPVD